MMVLQNQGQDLILGPILGRGRMNFHMPMQGSSLLYFSCHIFQIPNHNLPQGNFSDTVVFLQRKL